MLSKSSSPRSERAAHLTVAGLACLVWPTLLLLMVAPPTDVDRLFPVSWFVIGLIVAALVLRFASSPYRILGVIPPASAVWLGTAVWGAVTDRWPAWAHGPLMGLTLGPLGRRRTLLGRPETIRGQLPLIAVTLIGVCIAGGFNSGVLPRAWAAWYVVGVLGLLTLIAWLRLFRPAFELAVEPLLWLMYRIRAAGPGLAQVPARGPVLVVANHACWFDPLFLAKVLPRPVTPMMTSRFYDLPVMSWLMRRVFHSIRVPEKPSKEEMPEAVREAIAALDRGECVVIFPEGFLRRTEEKPLRRFGRGVWQILAARPDTPVFCCWIEGGWGSYASYFNGKPTKNKRPDFRRPIGVGVSAPVAVDAATLANHLQTRVYLMNRVAEARTLLGLPDLPPFELPTQEGKDDEEE